MSSKTSSNATEISFRLTGRVCIVTGGAQGIGEACIRRFARENARVVIADIDDVRGAALASELGGLFDHCDVGDKAQVDALLSQTIAAHGRTRNVQGRSERRHRRLPVARQHHQHEFGQRRSPPAPSPPNSPPKPC